MVSWKVRPRKKDLPKYISLIAFRTQIHTHTHTDSVTSSCNHSLVSHQLNFLSQIIFHFPEASQKQQEENSQTTPLKKVASSGARVRKKIAPPFQPRARTWKAKCFYFKIYHLQQLSSKFVPPLLDLSLTFLRSHRNWLKLYFLPPGHLLPSFPASQNLQARQQQRPRSHKFKKFSRIFLFAIPPK